jgi:hypothetical protein
LLGDQNDPDVSEIVGLITYTSPRATYLGCGKEPAGDGTLVLYRPNSLKQAGKLVERGIDPKRISFMPLTTENSTAPWVIWSNFKDRPELRQDLRSPEAYSR